MEEVKGSRKGKDRLHAIVLKLCRVERKEEDVMVTAEADEAMGNTREVFFNM